MEEALGDSSGITRAGAAPVVCLLLVGAAVKPRLVWRQLDPEEAPRSWRHRIGTGLQTDALVPLQVYLYIRSRRGLLTGRNYSNLDRLS